MGKAARVTFLIILAAAAAFGLWKYGAIAQPEAYHHFADTRTVQVGVGRGVANGWNVLSNIPFAIVGWLGLSFLRRGPTRNPDGPFRPGAHTAFETLRERPAYVLFFAGVLLTAFGSGYYHLAPTTTRLFWDRLPMSIGFTALFCAVIAERISIYWSRMLLLPFVFLGVASVVMWRLSELSGHGDLRVYIFVQLFPMIALPLIMLMFPARYSRGPELFIVVVVYALAKGLEQADWQVWEATQHGVSGHSLKHVVAAIATWFVLDMLKKRGRAPLPLHEALALSAEDAPPSGRLE